MKKDKVTQNPFDTQEKRNPLLTVILILAIIATGAYLLVQKYQPDKKETTTKKYALVCSKVMGYKVIRKGFGCSYEKASSAPIRVSCAGIPALASKYDSSKFEKKCKTFDKLDLYPRTCYTQTQWQILREIGTYCKISREKGFTRLWHKIERVCHGGQTVSSEDLPPFNPFKKLNPKLFSSGNSGSTGSEIVCNNDGTCESTESCDSCPDD